MKFRFYYCAFFCAPKYLQAIEKHSHSNHYYANHTYHSITVTCQRSHSISNQTNLKTINFQPYATTNSTLPCNNDYSNVTCLRTASVTAFLSVLRWFSSEFCFQATCLSSYHPITSQLLTR